MNRHLSAFSRGFREGISSAWRPREAVRLYFAPISRGLWRHAIAAGRRGGWRAGFKTFFEDGDLMARGQIPWW